MYIFSDSTIWIGMYVIVIKYNQSQVKTNCVFMFGHEVRPDEAKRRPQDITIAVQCTHNPTKRREFISRRDTEYIAVIWRIVQHKSDVYVTYYLCVADHQSLNRHLYSFDNLYFTHKIKKYTHSLHIHHATAHVVLLNSILFPQVFLFTFFQHKLFQFITKA